MEALNRLDLTGDLDSSTPDVVIEEVIDAHGLTSLHSYLKTGDRSRATKAINSLPVIYACQPYSKNDLKKLARYVNDRVEWRKSILLEAHLFMKRMTAAGRPNVADLENIGRQTPEHPHRLNACVLFHLIKRFRLNYSPHITLHQMAELVRLSLLPRIRLEGMLMRVLDSGGVNDVLELIARHQAPPKKEQITTESQAKALSVLGRDMRYLPRTANEAVITVAMQCKIDISSSSDPILLAGQIMADGANADTFTPPLGDTMRALYIRNRMMFNLKETFNPIFPTDVYDRKSLRRMANFEGYTGVSDPYSALQVAYRMEGVYHRLWPEVTNTETPIDLERVSDLNPEDVVCIGVRGEKMTAFTMQELISLFAANRNFKHPLEKDAMLNGKQITKLKHIARSAGTDVGSKLLSTIENLETTLQSGSPEVAKLAALYLSERKSTSDALMSLFHVGMYMRGWKGSDFYPMTSPEANGVELSVIEVNVANELRKFYTLIDVLGKDTFLRLPLMKWTKNGYMAPISVENGGTVGDRLKVIQQGEYADNYDSCVRQSSNFIIGTSCYYMQLIGITIPIDISAMTNIY